MKNHIKLLTPLCLALLAITSPARADGPNDRDNEHNGTPAAKVVELEARTLLTPPVVTGATDPSGSAALEAENVDGTLSAEVSVRTRGLAAGTYTVAVTKKSDKSSVTLGTFVIAPVTMPAVASSCQRESSSRQGSVKFTTGGTNPLPAGFDGFDVATISVSDSKGTVVLGGDLTTSIDRVTRVHLTPGATAATASGFASVFTNTRAGVTTSHFSLTAKGLPVSAALTLAINGADVQPAPSDARGRLRVRTLPASVDVAAIKTVEIHDATPATLLSGSL